VAWVSVSDAWQRSAGVSPAVAVVVPRGPYSISRSSCRTSAWLAAAQRRTSLLL